MVKIENEILLHELANVHQKHSIDVLFIEIVQALFWFNPPLRLHSFATILVRSGVPLALASQSLGHTNVLTTQKYFAGFDLDAYSAYFEVTQ